MPLYLRQIWSIDVGRKYRPESVGFHRPTENVVDKTYSNLISSKEECVNRTLANIIRQLGDLALKSHQIFG